MKTKLLHLRKLSLIIISLLGFTFLSHGQDSCNSMDVQATFANPSNCSATDGSIKLKILSPDLPPVNNLKVWLSAGKGVVLGRYGRIVKQWQDLSGNNNHFNLSSGSGIRWDSRSSSMGWKPTITFDRTSNLLSTYSINSGSYTIIVVGVSHSVGDERLVTSTNDWYLGWSDLKKDVFYTGKSVAPGVRNRYTSMIYTASANGASQNLWGNGVLLGSTTTGGANVPQYISLGGVEGHGLVSKGGKGEIAELLVYNRVLTANERVLIEKYLAEKYSIDGPSGAGSYSYLWSDGPTTKDRFNLGNGSYQVSVTEPITGCVSTKSFGLKGSGSSLTATAIAVSTTCSGRSDGSINLYVSGGVIQRARVVKIVQLDNQELNTNEIEVFEAGTNTNVALASAGGVASQSTTYSGLYPATLLNDGEQHNGVGAHTGSGVDQWQKVSWPTVKNIDKIVIWNRDNCCTYRLDNIRIEIYSDDEEKNLLFSQVVDADTGAGNAFTLLNLGNTYLWSNGATVENPSGLLPGRYDVTVTQADDCASQIILNDILVTDPPYFHLRGTITNPSNCSDSDGSIDVTEVYADSAEPNAFNDLALWTKGQEGVIKNDDGDVLKWLDLSGNNNHFLSSGDGIIAPTSRDMRHKTIIRFDGTNSMTVTNAISGNNTIIVVGKLNGRQNKRLVSSNNKNWLLGWWNGFEDAYHPGGWVHGPPSTSATTSPVIYTTTEDIGGDSYSFFKNGSKLNNKSFGSRIALKLK